MVLFSSAAIANVIYTWTADGVTESVAQQATAIFNFSSKDSLTITLTNNVAPTASITSEVDGLVWSLTSAPATATLAVSIRAIRHRLHFRRHALPAGRRLDALRLGHDALRL